MKRLLAFLHGIAFASIAIGQTTPPQPNGDEKKPPKGELLLHGTKGEVHGILIDEKPLFELRNKDKPGQPPTTLPENYMKLVPYVPDFTAEQKYSVPRGPAIFPVSGGGEFPAVDVGKLLETIDALQKQIDALEHYNKALEKTVSELMEQLAAAQKSKGPTK